MRRSIRSLPVLLLLLIPAWIISPLGAQSEPEPTSRYDANVSTVPAFPVSNPELDESPRPWVDATGIHSFMATLTGLDGDHVLLDLAIGGKATVPLDRLSVADREYALTAATPRHDASAKVILGRVFAVTDGDTIKIKTVSGRTRTVRLLGIDAPEGDQPFGDESAERLSELVDGKDVRVEYSEQDRYRRYLGTVYVDDRPVNPRMVREGFAWHYVEYSDDRCLSAAEKSARRDQCGLWSDDAPIAPWDWRSGKRTESP